MKTKRTLFFSFMFCLIVALFSAFAMTACAGGGGHEHELSKVNAKDATCTEAGNEEYYTCSGCDKIFADAEGKTEIEDKNSVVKAALGHNPTLVEETDSTCKVAGHRAYYDCTRCHTKFTDQTGETVIEDITTYNKELKAHTLQEVPAKEATCTEDGNLRHFKCTECEDLFMDEDGKTPVVDESGLIDPATGHHTTKHDQKDVDCEEDGNLLYWYCDWCEKNFKDEFGNEPYGEDEQVIIPATGHSYSSGWQSDDQNHWHPSTCKHEGLKSEESAHEFNGTKECQVCHYSLEVPETTEGLEYKLSANKDFYIVTGLGTAAREKDIVIPSTHESEGKELPVQEIGPNAFDACTGIRSITIPTSIKVMRTNAFRRCTALTKVNYLGDLKGWSEIEFTNTQEEDPDSEIAAGDSPIVYSNPLYVYGALYLNNVRLEDLNIPTGTTKINDYTFQGINVKSITIPDTVTEIGYAAFYTALATDVDLGNGVQKIDDYALTYMPNMYKITLPASITELGYKCFIGNALLEVKNYMDPAKVDLKKQDPSIDKMNEEAGFQMFQQYDGSYYSLDVNGIHVYNDKAELEEDRGESNISFIGDFLFQPNAAGTTLTLKKYLGSESKVVLPSLPSEAEDPIQVTVPEDQPKATGADMSKFHTYSVAASFMQGDSNLQILVISDSVASIGNKAFMSCGSLIQVTLGRRITTLTKAGNNAPFRSCNKLKEVYNLSSYTLPALKTKKCISEYLEVEHKSLDEPSCLQTNAQGYTFFKTPSSQIATLITYTGAEKDITLPQDYEGVKYEIGQAAFSARGLTKVTIPANAVTTIGNSAFRMNTLLTEVTIGDGVTSLGISCFENCNALENITIPETVTSIGGAAFFECNMLQEIQLPSKLTYLGGNYVSYSQTETDGSGMVFYECTSLTEITIPGGVSCLPTSTFFGCTSLKTVHIAEKTTRQYFVFGQAAFNACYALENVDIPSDTTKISTWAFGYNALKTVEIPENCVIENASFAYCSELVHVTVNKGVKLQNSEMANMQMYLAFQDCYKIIEVLDLRDYSGYPNTDPSDKIVAGGITLGGVAYNALYVYNERENSRVEKIGDYLYYNPEKAAGKASSEIEGYSNKWWLLGYCADKPMSGTVTLPTDKDYSIYNFAFAYNEDIIDVTIPDNVDYIGAYAFASCPYLTDVKIGNNVTIIAAAAFYIDYNLRNVTIGTDGGSKLETIGQAAFESCHNLASLKIETSKTWHVIGSLDGETNESIMTLTPEQMKDGVTATVYITGGYSQCIWTTNPDQFTTPKD